MNLQNLQIRDAYDDINSCLFYSGVWQVSELKGTTRAYLVLSIHGCDDMRCPNLQWGFKLLVLYDYLVSCTHFFVRSSFGCIHFKKAIVFCMLLHTVTRPFDGYSFQMEHWYNTMTFNF